MLLVLTPLIQKMLGLTEKSAVQQGLSDLCGRRPGIPVGQLAQKGNNRLMAGKLFLIAGLQADHAFAGNAHLLLGQTTLLRTSSSSSS